MRKKISLLLGFIALAVFAAAAFAPAHYEVKQKYVLGAMEAGIT